MVVRSGIDSDLRLTGHWHEYFLHLQQTSGIYAAQLLSTILRYVSQLHLRWVSLELFDRMVSKWLIEAVSNNAAWCDAVAASHGITSRWEDSLWLSKHPMPPFYPNIVTLKSGVQIEEQIDFIAPHLPLGWGIKDSFSELDLNAKGFVLAFNAHWYYRPPSQSLTREIKSRFHLQTVKTQSELDRWIAAWGEGNKIFNLSLLENSAVELVYVEHDGKMVSGLATNLSGDSLGISNAYGQADDMVRCVDLAVQRHPEKAIVGYGDQSEVEALSRIGFKVIGDLRVWLRA